MYSETAEATRDFSDLSPAGLLTAALQVAVPMWIHDIRDWADDERLTAARGCGQTVAEHGDDILYRSPRKGKTAEAFNALARGLACAAYQPGGVRFHGTHFCTSHSACLAAEATR
jgi:hypothetical protein